MPLVYIGMGSNLSEPALQLQDALTAMNNIHQTSVVQVSSCYGSKPMGPAEQPDYVNAVAALETSLSSMALLQALQKIELQQGRVRKKERWGPRTLDLDILLYGMEIINEPDLVVPHYGMKQREFVIHPLFEVAPDLTLPCGTSVAALLKCIPHNGIKRLPYKIGNHI
ncbi:2-amino-4-hydroxy-6-hydroxymethyldihydropteridine diphosphokinase [Alteromonas sp. a30]|uniref:2-amino-4-hydroxy-6- hydroxymethyldihydropteridine diphosphokinase n=1 Tax=Alteromonas sp. a30 TaxID=2730917 RepID=UPI00227F87C5|nr:2-amino-4-hydroxy-6-hydroxymethyldihydropteridine diphosphokinase [Alteromonas sp. a30]MCY7296776.1 2-amino-4-hydroxy-6-hydroxymethyldihydropteridine diphosphokinase [Alteromonas sp. a30]